MVTNAGERKQRDVLRRPFFGMAAVVLLCAGFGGSGCESTGGDGADESDGDVPAGLVRAPASFQRVQPVLEARCLPCHYDVQVPGMIDLSSRKVAVASGALNASNPLASPIVAAARRGDGDPGAMPPTGHSMTAHQLATLENWLAVGAPWPTGEVGALRPAVGAEPRSN